MKKVFMSIAVVALMVAAASCGNNAKKAEAEDAAAETEAVVDTVAAVVDSTAAAVDSTVAQ